VKNQGEEKRGLTNLVLSSLAGIWAIDGPGPQDAGHFFWLNSFGLSHFAASPFLIAS
jgi:hypothetical protein